MIFDFFLNNALGLFNWVISLITIPASQTVAVSTMVANAYGLIQTAGNFFPLELLGIILGNILMWLAIHFVISVIRFLLDFIPFF